MNRTARRFLPVFTMLALAGPARAADYVVTSCGDNGGPTQLRARIASANSTGGGTITFSCGPAAVILGSPLTVTQPVVLDGGNEIEISGGNATGLFIAQSTLTLRDVVLSRALMELGAAVYVEMGRKLVTDGVRFEDNYGFFGGAIYNDRGELELTDTVFENNDAEGDGAAIYNYRGVIEMDRVDFLGNVAVGYGGAISSDAGTIVWHGGRAISNEGGHGGVINNFDAVGDAVQGQVEVRDVLLERNESALGHGGVFLNWEPAGFDLFDSTARGNEANQGGGVIANFGYFSMYGSTFDDNNATTGGAIYSTGNTDLENSTISHSYADTAQTIWHSTGALELDRVTIVGDDIGSNSNIHVEGGGTAYLSNSVITRPPNGPNCSATGGFYESRGYNVIDDASCSFFSSGIGDQNSIDPKLGPLADNGGPTLTHLPLPGSPLVDEGTTQFCPPVDQRGVGRPQDASCDAGAVEVASCDAPVPTLCGDATGDGARTAADALRALRASVGSLECGLWLCDFNGAGGVTAADALAILRVSVGQVVAANCPDPWDCREELW